MIFTLILTIPTSKSLQMLSSITFNSVAAAKPSQKYCKYDARLSIRERMRFQPDFHVSRSFLVLDHIIWQVTFVFYQSTLAIQTAAHRLE